MIDRTLEAVADGMKIAVLYRFELLTGTRRCLAQYSFSTYFRKAYWDWCSVGCLILRIDIHSLVPLCKRSQLPEWIEDVCGNQNLPVVAVTSA